jgi:hypothetical protein
MSKGLHRSMSRAQAQAAAINKVTVPVRGAALNVADGAPGFGTVVIGALPQGNILFLGCVSYLQFATASATITATFDGDYSIGTTPTADGTITGSDADIVPSAAMGAATAKLSPVVRSASTDALGGMVIDNTDGSLELNLNVLIDDAAISGAAAFTVNGTVDIAYIVLGDD